MVVCDPIVDAMDLDGGSVVARTPPGTRTFASGDCFMSGECVFADVALGGPRSGGQGVQAERGGILSQSPVKLGNGD